jgi:hypothetical protein
VNRIALSTLLAIGSAPHASDARPPKPIPTTASHAYLHWSAPKKVVSPDQAWELEVIPIYTGDGNHSPVVVRKRAGGRANDVLTLQRDAHMYWGGRRRLLIIDHPITVPRRILLFRLGSTGDVTRLRATPDLDADIRARVIRALGRTEEIVFYIPTFGSWTDARLVLRVGGTAVYRKTAPSMTPYCYRITVNSRTAKVESMTQEPQRDDRTTCQNYP